MVANPHGCSLDIGSSEEGCVPLRFPPSAYMAETADLIGFVSSGVDAAMLFWDGISDPCFVPWAVAHCREMCTDIADVCQHTRVFPAGVSKAFTVPVLLKDCPSPERPCLDGLFVYHPSFTEIHF